MGRFGLAVGRFGHTEYLWAVLVWAVLVHGPFWSFPDIIRQSINV